MNAQDFILQSEVRTDDFEDETFAFRRLDVLKGNQVVPKALGLSAVAVAGTVAETKIQPLVLGDIIEFQALIRMHLSTILDQISSTAHDIPLPVEFVFLDLE